MENFDVAITLKVPEWNYIMADLGQRPYGEVAESIAIVTGKQIGRAHV